MARWLIDSLATGGTALVVADAVAKATILLGLTTAVAAVFYRSAAAVRHRLWSLTLCGLLVLPLLSWLLPGWRLPIVPSTVGLIGSRASSIEGTAESRSSQGANAGAAASVRSVRPGFDQGSSGPAQPAPLVAARSRHSRIRADDGRLPLVAGVHRGDLACPSGRDRKRMAAEAFAAGRRAGLARVA